MCWVWPESCCGIDTYNLLCRFCRSFRRTTFFEEKKSCILTKPNDSAAKGAAKGAIHPSGSKFINSWLWKHYKLSPHSDCDKCGLCVVCQKAGDTCTCITWVSRVDGSTTRMKKHLLEAHNMSAHVERTHM